LGSSEVGLVRPLIDFWRRGFAPPPKINFPQEMSIDSTMKDAMMILLKELGQKYG
jgi:hypothetical protein